jgi:hypothetical protein
MTFNVYALSSADSTQEDFWDDYPWTKGSGKMGKMDLGLTKGTPTLEVNYGLGNASIHERAFGSKFEDTKSFDIRFGHSDIEDKSKYVYEYDMTYLQLGKITSEWNSKRDTGKIRTDAWRFGIGDKKGYGYKFNDNTGILFYHGGAMNWTKINFKDKDINPGSRDSNEMAIYGNSFRFGKSMEGGITVQPFKPFAINVAYERAMVFPRTMFWYWAGSEIVKGVGEGLINEFVEEVFESTPEALPIVSFVLLNAYNYGFYELTKKHMNWPIYTATPMMYENFKIGATFNF